MVRKSIMMVKMKIMMVMMRVMMARMRFMMVKMRFRIEMKRIIKVKTTTMFVRKRIPKVNVRVKLLNLF
jgi:hypothetical protein